MRDGRALRKHCANCDRPDILPLVISTEPIGCLVEAMARVRGGRTTAELPLPRRSTARKRAAAIPGVRATHEL